MSCICIWLLIRNYTLVFTIFPWFCLSTTYWRLSQFPFPSILGGTQLLSHLSFWTFFFFLHLDTKLHYSPNNSVLTTIVSSIDKLGNPATLPEFYGAPSALPRNPAVLLCFEFAGVSFAFYCIYMYIAQMHIYMYIDQIHIYLPFYCIYMCTAQIHIYSP